MSNYVTIPPFFLSAMNFDELPPIVVRQFRRLVRSNVMTWCTALYFTVAIVAFGACLISVGSPRSLEDIAFWQLAGTGPVLFLLGIIAYLPALMLASAQMKDELLDLPIEPRQRLHSYLWVGLLLSLYFCALSLPFVTLSSLFGGSLSQMLCALAYRMGVAFVMSLVVIAFLNKVKTMPGLIISTVLLFFFLPVPATVIGFTEMIVAFSSMISVFSSITSSSAPPSPTALGSAYTPCDPEGVFITVFSGVAHLVFGIVAYYLSLSHLRRYHRSVWAALGLNIAVFVFLIAITAIAWLVCRLVFGLV